MPSRLITLLILLVLAGCDARIEKFDSNRVFALTLAKSQSTPTEAAASDTSAVVDAMFGTPDAPLWPEQILDESARGLVSLERLQRAAGPVSSDKDGTHRGLYREHCVICHGLSGSGTGPASLFQNPYPRDFRHGVFKWKSTERASKPTREDLADLLVAGVPGTGMPSFTLLTPDDREALVDYVIYLSIRGEVERRLMAAAVYQLGYEESAPDPDARLTLTNESEGGDVVYEVVTRVVTDWVEADEDVVEVPEFPQLSGTELQESLLRGDKIFHGPIANCVGCHGPGGNGHAATLDYDDWTKDFTTRVGITPTDREAIRPLREAGALRPRTIVPRALQGGVFHGGSEPETLYRRITQGIAGTPMPGVEVTEQPSGKSLTPAQAWDLVRYVRSLSKSGGG